MSRLPTALLGSSGWIGQHFARLLGGHPEFEEPLLTGARSAGRTLEEVWQLADQPVPRELVGHRIVEASPAKLAARGVRVVFSALPSSEAGPVERELARRGLAVFSNASAHRMDPRVPLLIPEINRSHLSALGRPRRGRGFLVTNSNCSTSGLALALAPLVPLVRPREVFVATYQALSGAGYPGVPSLAIEDNVLPWIEDEEEKLQLETGKILGSWEGGAFRPRALPVSAHCARVGSREGHLEAITVRMRSPRSAEEIRRAWEGFQPLAPPKGSRASPFPTAPEHPLVFRPEADRPQPLRDRWAGRPERARGMAVSVGRLRVRDDELRFFALVHNAVRGGAGGSVLNAEVALQDGYLEARS